MRSHLLAQLPLQPHQLELLRLNQRPQARLLRGRGGRHELGCRAIWTPPGASCRACTISELAGLHSHRSSFAPPPAGTEGTPSSCAELAGLAASGLAPAPIDPPRMARPHSAAPLAAPPPRQPARAPAPPCTHPAVAAGYCATPRLPAPRPAAAALALLGRVQLAQRARRCPPPPGSPLFAAGAGPLTACPPARSKRCLGGASFGGARARAPAPRWAARASAQRGPSLQQPPRTPRPAPPTHLPGRGGAEGVRPRLQQQLLREELQGVGGQRGRPLAAPVLGQQPLQQLPAPVALIGLLLHAFSQPTSREPGVQRGNGW